MLALHPSVGVPPSVANGTPAALPGVMHRCDDSLSPHDPMC